MERKIFRFLLMLQWDTMAPSLPRGSLRRTRSRIFFPSTSSFPHTQPEKPKALSLQASEYSFDYVNPQEEFEDEQNHYHLLLTGVTLETALEMESFEAKKRIDQSAPRLVVQDESMNGDLTYMIYNDDVASTHPHTPFSPTFVLTSKFCD